MNDDATSDAARALSRKGASKGGVARAASMTAAERHEAAVRAARARWCRNSDTSDDGQATDDLFAPLVEVLPATERPYSVFSGTLPLGDKEVQCHVLNDGRRVLTQREVVRALTNGRVSGSYLQGIPGFDTKSLRDRVIQFTNPGGSHHNHGYEATLLIEICEAYLDARDRKDGSLKPNQEHIAQAAEVIVRACARVGIIALIDEVTGYQEVRAKNALQVKLQMFIAEQMGEWSKRFPDEFWVELARLEGIKYSGRNRPWRWGKYVMKFVYEAIDADVSNKLAEINPGPAKGHNHHQWLTEFGKKDLNDHLQQVIAVMRLCTDMDDFKRKFPRAFPSGPVQMELAGGVWEV